MSSNNWTYSDWKNSKARVILKDIPKNRIDFVFFEDMTKQEKQKHPSAETTGGYLKIIKPTAKQKQEWWDELPDTEKEIIKSIPNFDAAIFKQITGIDVEA